MKFYNSFDRRLLTYDQKEKTNCFSKRRTVQTAAVIFLRKIGEK